MTSPNSGVETGCKLFGYSFVIDSMDSLFVSQIIIDYSSHSAEVTIKSDCSSSEVTQKYLHHLEIVLLN
jgi:ribosome-interacting GTPase 1